MLIPCGIPCSWEKLALLKFMKYESYPLMTRMESSRDSPFLLEDPDSSIWGQFNKVIVKICEPDRNRGFSIDPHRTTSALPKNKISAEKFEYVILHNFKAFFNFIRRCSPNSKKLGKTALNRKVVKAGPAFELIIWRLDICVHFSGHNLNTTIQK